MWCGARSANRFAALDCRVAQGGPVPGPLDICAQGRGQREEVGLQAGDNALSGDKF